MANTWRVLLVVCCGGLFAGGASAQLATYDFSSLSGITAGPVAGTAGPGANGGLTIGGLSRGSGLSAGSATGGFSSSSFTLTTGSAGLTAANTANDFYAFSLTPTIDGTFDFAGAFLTFGSRVSTTLNQPTLSLLSSRDGFASAVATVGITSTSASNYSLDISGLGSFATTSGSSLDFRLVGYGVNAGTTTLRLENATVGGLNIGGTFTPVPEPATVLAIAAGGLGLFRIRRRLI